MRGFLECRDQTNSNCLSETVVYEPCDVLEFEYIYSHALKKYRTINANRDTKLRDISAFKMQILI